MGVGGWAAYVAESGAEILGASEEDLLLATLDRADGHLLGAALADLGLEVASDGDGDVLAPVSVVSIVIDFAQGTMYMTYGIGIFGVTLTSETEKA